MAQGRDRQLRELHKLCKKFLAIEQAAREDLRNKLLAESNRIAQEQLELKRDEYRRRRELGIARKVVVESTRGVNAA
jgi:hypothetical protein